VFNASDFVSAGCLKCADRAATALGGMIRFDASPQALRHKQAARPAGSACRQIDHGEPGVFDGPLAVPARAFLKLIALLGGAPAPAARCSSTPKYQHSVKHRRHPRRFSGRSVGRGICKIISAGTTAVSDPVALPLIHRRAWSEARNRQGAIRAGARQVRSCSKVSERSRRPSALTRRASGAVGMAVGRGSRAALAHWPTSAAPGNLDPDLARRDHH